MSRKKRNAPLDNILQVVLEVGENLQLSVNYDLDQNTKMTWISSDISIATVDSQGIVVFL